MFAGARFAAGSLAIAGLAVGVLVVQAPVSAGTPTFRLQLLHASDLEGGVAAIDRAPNFAALVDALEDAPGMGASITLSAGDNYIPGPFFSASGDPLVAPALAAANGLGTTTASAGRADASIMNVIGFDASALGNHEFDLGSREVRNIIAPAGTWPGVQFPYLSANLNFEGDVDLLPLVQSTVLPSSAYRSGGAAGIRKIAPYTVIDEGGQRIGVVGATTPILQTISSPTGTTVIGPNTNDMPALAAVLQPRINELLADGVNKVVLVSHLQQISLEQTLAPLLSGVDIIVAGGSDTILANPDDILRPPATAAGGYPFLATSSTGDPVAIVSTDGEYTYVGRLVVDFDADGILVAPDGSPLNAISDLDLPLNGPVATTDTQVAAEWGPIDPFTPGTKGSRVKAVVDAVETVVIAKDSTVFGETSVFIDGRRSEVRTQETNLGNLSADANLFVARQTDPTVRVSIKNGGGIRAEIGEVRNTGATTQFLPPQANTASGKRTGQVSQLDIENSLRFNNTLSLVTTTAAGFLSLVEHGVRATLPGATPGQFPQVGGFTFSFDSTLPPGDRVQSIIVGEGASQEVLVANSEVVGDPTRPIRLVTLNFLANGGDGYPFGPVPTQVNRVDLVQPGVRVGAARFADNGTEQDAFAEYLVVNHGNGGTAFSAVETPPALDARIRNLAAVPTTVSVTALDGSAAEQGVDPGTFRFTRIGGLGAPLTVTYSVGGTASGPDYLPALTGTVVIPALSATVDATITPIDDVVVEGNETVVATVTDTATYDPGTASSATITIADNDVAPGVDLSAFRQYGAADGIAGAEIVSVRGDRAVVSDAKGTAYVLDANDLLDMKVLTTVPGLAGLNSVAIHPTADYFLAVGGSASPSASPVNGTLWAYRLDGMPLGSVATGIQPDSVAITPDGTKAVIANEAEGFVVGNDGGPGSLTVVDLTGAMNPLGTVTNISLPSYAGATGFSAGRTDDLARLPITNAPVTLEPETVTFDASSSNAYISLQENNAVLKLNLATNAITPFGLGTTTHLMDVSTSGGYVPVSARTELREPDGIAVVTIGGIEYFVTADEGDTRTGSGSSDVRGGRTVSVFRADTGAFVGDTGKGLDDAAARFGVYPDIRSNRGGAEPEVLDAAVFNGTPLAVVGLERANRLAVIDLSVPAAPVVLGLIPAGDRPEGVKLVERNGTLFAVVGNEGDGTATAPGTVTVTRVPVGDEVFTQRFVEDTPGPVHDLVAVTSDPARTVDVTLTLDDPAAGSLSATTFSGPASAVNVALGGVTFTPTPNWNGTVEVAVSVTAGAATDTGFVTLVVAPVDDAPTLRLLNTSALCLGDDLVALTVALSDIDSPTSALRLTASSTNSALVRPSALSLLGNGSSRLLVVRVSSVSAVTTGSVVLTLSDAVNTVTVPIGVVSGTTRADVLSANPSAPSIVVGRAGNDAITGGPLTDIICGGLGNDTIDAGAGDDAMFGGFGNDRLTGGIGLDLFSGGLGNDMYVDVDATAGDIAWPF